MNICNLCKHQEFISDGYEIYGPYCGAENAYDTITGYKVDMPCYTVRKRVGSICPNYQRRKHTKLELKQRYRRYKKFLKKKKARSDERLAGPTKPSP